MQVEESKTMSEVGLSRLAQQNHQSVILSKFVNDKISDCQVNKAQNSVDAISDTVKDETFDND